MTGRVERHIKIWLQDFVVDLNLCPFARPLLGASNLRIVVCDESVTAAMQKAFLLELDVLQSSPEREVATSLLAFPNALHEFHDYLRFLEDAQDLLLKSGLEGIVQLASFHPQYLFAGEASNAASHYSNRAPYPLIHLLREDMLSRVLADFADSEKIPERNIEMLDGIGVDKLERRWHAIFKG